MHELLAFLLVLVVAVGGAEVVRATCRRQLSAPVRARVDRQPSRGVLSD